MEYRTKLEHTVPAGIGLCVGLDPVVEKMPTRFKSAKSPLLEFNLDIIEATADFAAAYKPNMAFYEVFGAEGWRQLAETIKAVPAGKIIIADGKRGDIGNTAKAYAAALFDGLGADAATVNPYLGRDALEPFVADADRGVFILAVTSNPGGADIQNLQANNKPVFLHIVDLARQLNKNRNVGLVVGATKPEDMLRVLDAAVDLPLLIPGVGEQGGEVQALKSALQGYRASALVNAARSIIYASCGEDYKLAARQAAEKLAGELAA